MKNFKLTIWALTEIEKNGNKRFLHNLFDCPICKTLKAGTGVFRDIEQIFKDKLKRCITCGTCKATFFPMFINRSFKNWEWEHITID